MNCILVVLSDTKILSNVIKSKDFNYPSIVFLVYLDVSSSGLITSVGEERADFFCYRLLVII